MMARADTTIDRVQLGSTLVAIAVVLQAGVQLLFAAVVGLLHYRTVKANMLTSKIRTVFIMLYGTSTLVILRSVFRSIEKFSRVDALKSGVCRGPCTTVLRNEWYLYAFEAAPMVLYMVWINIIHPGRFLPHDKTHFLDSNKIERVGPKEERKQLKDIRWMSLIDMGIGAVGDKPKDKYWERPGDWPVAGSDGRISQKESNPEEGISMKNLVVKGSL